MTRNQNPARRLFQAGRFEMVDAHDRYEVYKDGRRVWQSSFHSAMDYTQAYAHFKERSEDATQ